MALRQRARQAAEYSRSSRAVAVRPNVEGMDTGVSGDSSLVGGRFQRERCLRQQGPVQSWRGTDLETGEAVVVKTAPLHALQVGALERMLRDDAVLRDLRSSRLSPPLDCGLEEDLLFRVALLAPEGTLKERLARGPLSVKETLQLGRGLLR